MGTWEMQTEECGALYIYTLARFEHLPAHPLPEMFTDLDKVLRIQFKLKSFLAVYQRIPQINYH